MKHISELQTDPLSSEFTAHGTPDGFSRNHKHVDFCNLKCLCDVASQGGFNELISRQNEHILSELQAVYI